MSLSVRLMMCVSFVVFGASLRSADEKPNEIERRQRSREFIEAAVLQGLTKDQMSVALAKSLLGTRENWLDKCDICDACKHGFERYLQGPARGRSGLTADVEARLQSEREQVRLFALNQLIQRYVRAELKEPQRQWLIDEMQSMKKRTDEICQPPMGFCAVCEGACLLDPPSVVTEIVIDFKSHSYSQRRVCAVRVSRDGSFILERQIVIDRAVGNGEEVYYSFKPDRPKLSLGGKYQVTIGTATVGQPGPGGGFWTVKVIDGRGITYPVINRLEAPLVSPRIEITAGKR